MDDIGRDKVARRIILGVVGAVSRIARSDMK
jgi:hypothetical protein